MKNEESGAKIIILVGWQVISTTGKLIYVDFSLDFKNKSCAFRKHKLIPPVA
jgi:hypothetical protein